MSSPTRDPHRTVADGETFSCGLKAKAKRPEKLPGAPRISSLELLVPNF
jgi:hypothetical protein